MPTCTLLVRCAVYLYYIRKGKRVRILSSCTHCNIKYTRTLYCATETHRPPDDIRRSWCILLLLLITSCSRTMYDITSALVVRACGEMKIYSCSQSMYTVYFHCAYRHNRTYSIFDTSARFGKTRMYYSDVAETFRLRRSKIPEGGECNAIS